MLSAATFASSREYRSRVGEVDFWWPYLAEVLERHDLADARQEPVAGFNATYPTFLHGDVVVKLFGFVPAWRERHLAERGALALVATDPEILAPRLLGEGQSFDDVAAPWPYLITARVSGVALEDAAPSAEQRRSVAADLGRQVLRLQALRPSGVATDADWSSLNVVAAAERSSRIIDWGDAMVADRHFELIQLYRDMFGCDKALFRVFLEASEWPVGKDFPRQTLGLALYRQVVMLTQHLSGDVFEPIAAAFPLEDIGTLDELAVELFAV